MSWTDYINNSLLNKQDAAGHVYNNVLIQAAIYGHNGAKWAATEKFEIGADEINKFNDFFKQTSNGTPSLMMGGKKYQVTHYEPNAFAYLKIKEGGATIAKTNQAYIIGIYSTTTNYLYDGKPLPQNVGTCNTVVEELAKTLKDLGY